MNFLEKILDHKKQEVAVRKAAAPPEQLRKKLQDAPPPRSLKKALQGAESIGFIAEIKKASPSEGLIRENFDPVEIAGSYIRAGAEALSVLTDEQFFAGSLNFISQIRPFAPVPILRKDFIIDPYQVLEARIHGADTALLIVAALPDADLRTLLRQTKEYGMEALVEVHNRTELERALALDAEIIGINNRNLETFAVDIATTEKLAPLIPPGVTLITESGLSQGEQVCRMKSAGARGVLIGSYFMRQPDPGRALAELRACLKSSH